MVTVRVTDGVKGDGFNIQNGLFLPEGPAFPVFFYLFSEFEPWEDQRLEALFGCHAQYARYGAGQFLITPAQQKGVAPLYRKVGIAQVAPYHHMEEWYFFPKEMKAYHQ